MMSLRRAIANQEGFFKAGSRPQRNNNPGDLVYCPESVSFGAVSGDGRFARFVTNDVGWEALRRWLSVPAKHDVTGKLVAGYLGATLEQVINRFAPPNENDSAHYVAVVCALTGMTPQTVVTSAVLAAL